MTADRLTSNFRLNDGERLVWAAAYGAYFAQGNRPEVAARAATLAVLGLRGHFHGGRRGGLRLAQGGGRGDAARHLRHPRARAARVGGRVSAAIVVALLAVPAGVLVRLVLLVRREVRRRAAVLEVLAEGPRPTTQLLCAASRRLGGLGAIPIAAIAPLLAQLEREGLVVALRDPDLRGERPELPRYIWSLPPTATG
jgi:hypothetical protein